MQANSAFFDTVNLDGEAVLSEKYSASGDNISNGDIQTYRGLILCENPNPIMHSFNAKISIESEDFLQLTYKNLALRGSVLRNTNFVIGIVLYVGLETKAHLNSKTTLRKTSWLVGRMHRFIKWMFLAIGILVLILAIAGVIFDQTTNWP